MFFKIDGVYKEKRLGNKNGNILVYRFSFVGYTLSVRKQYKDIGGVENRNHYVRDVSMFEDASRIRKKTRNHGKNNESKW